MKLSKEEVEWLGKQGVLEDLIGTYSRYLYDQLAKHGKMPVSRGTATIDKGNWRINLWIHGTAVDVQIFSRKLHLDEIFSGRTLGVAIRRAVEHMLKVQEERNKVATGIAEVAQVFNRRRNRQPYAQRVQ